tara:strand:+ start:191 stop:349 length:159 start_codon:yes stop_codon:yes gene_type:complete
MSGVNERVNVIIYAAFCQDHASAEMVQALVGCSLHAEKLLQVIIVEECYRVG